MKNIKDKVNTKLDRFERLDFIEPLLTSREVCDILKIKYETLSHWVWLKKIEYIKIGNKMRRFKKSTIQKFIEERKKTFEEERCRVRR